MAATVTAPSAAEIHELTRLVIEESHELTAAEARALLEVEAGSEAFDALLAGARAIRDHFVGAELRFCSILNAKAGNCSENCSFCAQASGSDNTQYDKHKWMNDAEVDQAAASAADNGALALGLVAAWKGVKEGSQLDMVCESVRKLSQNGKLRADVNLGILESQTCADRLFEAGARVYGHNLETARSHFDKTCSSHSFEERMKTIQYIKQAGMGLCSGGIIGLGENKDQRVEFAEQLRFIEPNMIPINFLNPLQGTRLEDQERVDPDEALVTLAMLRFFLPERNIMVAGGKEVTFGDRLDEVLGSGINAVMVGNYLTTVGTDPQFWQREAPKHGLRIRKEVELDAPGACGSGCSC